MKKNYEKPSIEIEELSVEDVITTSGVDVKFWGTKDPASERLVD